MYTPGRPPSALKQSDESSTTANHFAVQHCNLLIQRFLFKKKSRYARTDGTANNGSRELALLGCYCLRLALQLRQVNAPKHEAVKRQFFQSLCKLVRVARHKSDSLLVHGCAAQDDALGIVL